MASLPERSRGPSLSYIQWQRRLTIYPTSFVDATARGRTPGGRWAHWRRGVSSMDSDGSAGEPGRDSLRSREEVLVMLNDVLSEAHRKVESGRVYDAEKERVR